MIYLTLAFVAVWLLVTLYVFFMSRKQSSLEQEMGTLEEMVAESTSRGGE
ncbi:MAG: CcmD family protein [Caldilineaceae bacterium]